MLCQFAAYRPAVSFVRSVAISLRQNGMAKEMLASPCKWQKGGQRNRIVGSLETAGLCCAKPAIDALPDESAQVVFSLQTGCEVATAAELEIRSVFKVDVAFP